MPLPRNSTSISRYKYVTIIIHIQISTFDLGVSKTVKLPKPLVNAGLRAGALLLLIIAGFLVTGDACDVLDNDWLELSPVFLGRRNERIDGRTPP